MLNDDRLQLPPQEIAVTFRLLALHLMVNDGDQWTDFGYVDLAGNSVLIENFLFSKCFLHFEIFGLHSLNLDNESSQQNKNLLFFAWYFWYLP